MKNIRTGVVDDVDLPRAVRIFYAFASVSAAPAVAATNLSLFETSATSGVYSGNIIFDKAGDWTVRFHIHEECFDFLDDSPHGHAAFRITVP